MYSFARYGPDDDSGAAPLSAPAYRHLLHRSCSVRTAQPCARAAGRSSGIVGARPASPQVFYHETAHLLGMKHCIYNKCLMNGSNSLEESAGKVLARVRARTWTTAIAVCTSCSCWIFFAV